ncbi:MAG TPA: hypothetical protein VEP90_30315 [Methylomirabilota bacterium]|nr:hypothetical protein [Methylomirabilota bacterium]
MTLETYMMICTVATLLMSAIIPMGGYAIPNVTNPWNDLLAGFGATPASTGSGTITQTQTPQNVQHSAALQGCAMGATTGVLIAAGGIAFAALTGGIGIPVAIGAVAVGLGGGCLLGGYVGNSFPSTTSQLFNSIISATGPLGTFLQGIVAVEQYVYPFIQFGLDWIPYEASLLSYEPMFATLMGSLVAITSLLWLIFIAKLFRGVGTLG